MKRASLFAAILLCGMYQTTRAAPIFFVAAGPTAASITGQVDAFRGALGPLNANTPTNNEFGRREVNWDGVPEANSSPNAFPGDFFNGGVAGRARGIEFDTPGTGFQVSANTGSGVLFGNLNPQYSALYSPFSPNKLFTAIGSTITDVTFFLPSDQTTPATVTGFGAVFSDVDTFTSTTMAFYDASNTLLGTFGVPAGETNKQFSFLGVLYNDGTRVSRVRITSGTATPGVEEAGGLDAVTMDDFIYGEPGGLPVPEPSTFALMGIAAGWLAWRRYRVRRIPLA
jgi:hypothetical protein